MSELLQYLTTHEDQFRRNRLPALYSDFRRLRTLNPDGYTANSEAWRKGLSDAARDGHLSARGSSGDALVLTLNEDLLRSLTHPELGRPLALGAVVRDAISAREMLPMIEYQAATSSIFKKSWGLSPGAIMWWGLRQLGLAGGDLGDDKIPRGKVVLLSNVENAFNALARRVESYTSRTDRILSKKLFQLEYRNILGGDKRLSETDLEILLVYISRDKHIAAYDGQTVKFHDPTEVALPKITSEDQTIASLKTLIADLEIQIATLTARVDTLAANAGQAVARKNRAAALSALRSKKLAETNLSQQNAVFGQLEEVFSKIRQASDQVDLARVMEGSAAVLKSLNAEVGGVERVDDIMDQLKEQMTQVDDVTGAISEPGQNNDDEAEVDEEFEALERAVKAQEEKARAEKKQEDELREAEQVKQKLAELDINAHEPAESRQSDPSQTSSLSELKNSSDMATREDSLGCRERSKDAEKQAVPAS